MKEITIGTEKRCVTVQPYKNGCIIQCEYLGRTTRTFGPIIEVYTDDSWIYIGGEIEATAMVNLECLPHLIKALQGIYKRLVNNP